MKPGGQQRGRRGQVGQVDQRRHVGLDGVEPCLLLCPGGPLGFPPVAFKGVELRGQLGNLAGADIFADNATAHLANAVVVASLPCHRLCYLEAPAPLPVCRGGRRRHRPSGALPSARWSRQLRSSPKGLPGRQSKRQGFVGVSSATVCHGRPPSASTAALQPLGSCPPPVPLPARPALASGPRRAFAGPFPGDPLFHATRQAGCATVPISARIAALMGSGSVGHAATRAARSASGMPPSLWSLRPALQRAASAVVSCLRGMGLSCEMGGLSIR